MRILLIRHAEQASKVCNADVSLSEKGRRQAADLADRLAGAGIEAIYTSPLLRACETAGAIADRAGLPVNVRGGLSEMDFGELTGLSHEARIEREKALSSERKGALPERPYPGGESYSEVYSRMQPVLSEITGSGLSCIAVISHLEALRAALAGMIGLPFSRSKLLLKGLPHTGIIEIIYDESRDLFFLKSIQ